MSLLVILWIGVINNNNINWTNAEEQENKRIARIVVIIETIMIVACESLGMGRSYVLFMSYGIILSAILLLIEKIRKEGESEASK